MAYVCSRCHTVYASEPENGCQGSKPCARGPRQSVTWVPQTSVAEAERRLAAGTLWRDTE